MFVKILVWTTLVVVLLIGGLLLGMAFQPDEFRVERSIVVAAPPAVVFPYMNDQKKAMEWSRWNEMDPNIKQTFEGPPSGVGAGYTWEGNNQVGAGRSVIFESKPDELVRLKLEFYKPFKGISTVDFTFTPEGDGTRVSWIMYGPNSFIGKAMGVFVDCNKICGDEFDKGLVKLKQTVEARKN